MEEGDFEVRPIREGKDFQVLHHAERADRAGKIEAPTHPTGCNCLSCTPERAVGKYHEG